MDEITGSETKIGEVQDWQWPPRMDEYDPGGDGSIFTAHVLNPKNPSGPLITLESFFGKNMLFVNPRDTVKAVWDEYTTRKILNNQAHE